MTPQLLIVYATTDGLTSQIAERLALEAEEMGWSAIRSRASDILTDHTLPPFDAAIVAAPVRFGKHLRSAAEFARRYRDELSAKPSAFLSVSASAASRVTGAAEESQRYIRQFALATGWHAERAIPVAGALTYSKYWFILRLIMRRIARKAGLDTDLSRDWVYTDWRALSNFVSGFLASAMIRSNPSHAEDAREMAFF